MQEIIKQIVIVTEIRGGISSIEQEQYAMIMRQKIINCCWKLKIRLLILKIFRSLEEYW